MSAAHELVERGYSVEVYEMRDHPGGKARSMGVPGTGKDGRPDLPGEHGFRFFPGFYRHLPDTMKRIPFGDQADGVFANLVQATRFQLAGEGTPSPTFVARFPTSIKELFIALKDAFGANLGIPDDELLYFVDRLFVILTSCYERRLAEYEKIPWWDFIGAATRSKAYQRYLAEGLTRSLVAMRAEIGSTRTVGDILIQLILDVATPGGLADRVLNGPTNEAWLSPWLAYLRQRGVAFHLGVALTGFRLAQGRITEVTLREKKTGRAFQASGDHFISALPVEVLTPLVTDEMKALDPGLGALANLKTEWMSGLQLYLREDVPLVHGHTIYADTPFALTSISQPQFWRGPVTRFGDGKVKGILSVDISDWETPGVLYGKPAKELTAKEIEEEVWAQIRRSLDDYPEAKALNDANLLDWHIDPDIQFPNPSEAVNLEPLLVNTAGSWAFRPEAVTKISNLFLASDFVRTYTDLATMEGANEAARRAVNGILAYDGGSAPPCALWPLHEPDLLAPLRDYDWLRFEMGLPYGSL